MYKRIFGILAGLISVLIIGFGVIIFLDIMKDDTPANSAEEETKSNEEEEVETQEVSELSDEKFENGEGEDLNPFGDTTEAADLRDAEFQEYIHKMSHQKVEADDKWGFYRITDERVNWLIAALDEAGPSHKDTYERILVKWQKADFSTVDEDHNEMWNLQGGNVGKATGILTESEEKQYMESAE
ncbi:DUF6241 domain-containing protein [Halobacillus andaensis]|uniref:DUF6241 domain-containing protein n=1 Tax=Halobacillus andaensis TaxID=1176239 RepID=UPI003D7114BA